jgi:hypothetical protein
LPTDLQIDRVEIRLDSKVAVAIESVNLVGALQKQVAYWWVVANLLDIDHASVWQTGLVSFAQDGVERLAPIVARVQESNARCHYMLHSKNWVA